jgi:hypothetical protein
VFDEYTIYNWRQRKFIKGTALPDKCRTVYMDILNNKSKFYDNLHNKTIEPAPWHSSEVWKKTDRGTDIVDVNYVELDDLDKIKNTMSDKNAIRTLPILGEILPYIIFCIEEVMQDKTKYYLKNWLNISPKSQRLPPHTHMGTYHGYWVINDTGTQTIYNIDDEDFPVDNFNGNFMFGPADVWHTLTPNTSDALRISLGFTIFTEQQITEQEKYPNSIFDKIGVTVD